jgi:hypothetical protein
MKYQPPHNSGGHQIYRQLPTISILPTFSRSKRAPITCTFATGGAGPDKFRLRLDLPPAKRLLIGHYSDRRNNVIPKSGRSR